MNGDAVMQALGFNFAALDEVAEACGQAFATIGELFDASEYDPCPDYEENTGRIEYTDADLLSDTMPGWEPWEPDEHEELDGFYEDNGD